MTPRPRGLPDAILAALVVLIVATMIVPLPTFALDLLLSLNLSVSIVVLVAALYAHEALAIASFPTILLLATLFRLSLEVAAARLILGRGDAGAVIHAFGSFVVHGNYVVGAVVFSIITLVQYLVIARGGERVAEVAARFTLDALPGKQLAIDAELRAGSIDGTEARRRRAHLARESSFYGAMDGALKFVKGDAIAGIVIALVNIVGGIAIGVGQHGMGVLDAVQRYGLLTIGQGLVAQVAAVVISAAAAILVTRVASEESGGSLGRDITDQVLRQPRALGLAALLMGGMALVPGMPSVPFLTLAALGALGAQVALRRERHGTKISVAPARASSVEALRLELIDGVAERIDETMDALQRETGLAFPKPVVDPVRAAGRVRVLIREVEAARCQLPTGKSLALAPEHVLAKRGIVGEGAEHPADGTTATWVDDRDVHAVRTDGTSVLGLGEVAVSFVAETLRRNAGEFVGVQETQAMLDAMEATHPALVRAAVPKPASVVFVAEALRSLLEERVWIRDLRSVLEGIAMLAPDVKDPVRLAEGVREGLARQITNAATTEGVLKVYSLSPDGAAAVRDGIVPGSMKVSARVDPEIAQELRQHAREQLGVARAVVLADGDVRKYVWRLLAPELPRVVVMAHGEVAATAHVEIEGVIGP